MAERLPFRGGLTCSCVVESLPWVELRMILDGLITDSIDIFQLGYRDDVGASAGTHNRGGSVDTGQFHAAQIDVWRRFGWTMQDRSPFFALDHGHGYPYKCPHLSPAALEQQRDWDNRKNGLVSGGPVIGRWPVLPWKQALAKEKALMADLAKDIATEIVKQGAAFGRAFAQGFLFADIIPSGKDESNPANKTQVPATYVKGDHDLLWDIREVLKKLSEPPKP
jgi:hypothetical protein